MLGTFGPRGRGSIVGFKMRKSQNIKITGLPLAFVTLFHRGQLSAGMCNGVPNACYVMHFPTGLYLLILLAVPSSVKYCSKLILLKYWNHVRDCSSGRILRTFLSSVQRNYSHQTAGKASQKTQSLWSLLVSCSTLAFSCVSQRYRCANVQPEG